MRTHVPRCESKCLLGALIEPLIICSAAIGQGWVDMRSSRTYLDLVCACAHPSHPTNLDIETTATDKKSTHCLFDSIGPSS